MSARKINNRWHVDFRLEGKRYRSIAPENSKGNAIDYEKLLRDEIAFKKKQGKKTKSGKIYNSYEEFLSDWYETYVLANNRPSEQIKKSGIIRNHLVPQFGQMKLEEISERDMEILKRDKLASGLAPKTIKNIQSAMRKSLECAVQWGYLDKIPYFTWIKVPKTEVSVISKYCEQELLNDNTNLLWNTMIIVALKTGMRLGEILALRWTDVNFFENLLNVNGSINVCFERAPTKNGKCRVIPMSNDVRSGLKRLFEDSRKKSGNTYVFDRGDEKPFSMYASGRMLKKITKQIGIDEHIHWHKLRHTFATNVAKRGVSMRILQELLGHSTILMTERYSHVDMEAKQNAIQLLDYKNENFGQILGRCPTYPQGTKNKTQPEFGCVVR